MISGDRITATRKVKEETAYASYLDALVILRLRFGMCVWKCLDLVDTRLSVCLIHHPFDHLLGRNFSYADRSNQLL